MWGACIAHGCHHVDSAVHDLTETKLVVLQLPMLMTSGNGGIDQPSAKTATTAASVANVEKEVTKDPVVPQARISLRPKGENK